MEYFLWVLGAYILGSISTLFCFRSAISEHAIENTISYFIDKGFIASKTLEDGEVELIKLKDYINGIHLEENKRRRNY
tara:strand:- start:292 stop:525 length:234 start_codon:yes stop_codon:yes gene_type:complete